MCQGVTVPSETNWTALKSSISAHMVSLLVPKHCCPPHSLALNCLVRVQRPETPSFDQSRHSPHLRSTHRESERAKQDCCRSSGNPWASSRGRYPDLKRRASLPVRNQLFEDSSPRYGCEKKARPRGRVAFLRVRARGGLFLKH